MKKKTKLQPSFAVYNFPYFRKSRSFFQIFWAKALLIAITSGAGAYYFTTELKLPDTAIWAALTAGIVSLAYFVLLGLYRQLYVNLFTAGVCAVGGLFFHEQIYKIGKEFYYQVLIAADGKFVDTSRLTMYHKHPKAVPMIILLCVVFGILCAYSFYHRYHPEGVLAFTAIMLVPAFLSLKTDYNPALAVFAAGNLGLWAMSSSLHLNSVLMVGGPVNTYAMDSEYRKANKKLSLKKRIREDSLNYGRYFQDGFVTVTIALLTISIVGASFPQDGSLKFDEVIKKAVESFQNIEGWGNGIFPDFGFKGGTFSGYFSADGGKINISNSIDSSLNSQSTEPVLEVITQSTDKLYLKGDVGSEFDSVNWKSIAETDFSKIYYQRNGENEPIEKIFRSYIPELELLNARASLLGSNPDLVQPQTVKINYLTKMNTVLFPGTPFIYNFRENKDFTVKGDFVALADRGRINSMETAVLYPGMYAAKMLTEREIAVDSGCISSVEGLTEWDYTNYVSVYGDFVNSFYMGVPDNEKPYIRRFLEECYNGSSDSNDIQAEDIRSLETPSEIAARISEYLSRGGGYKYSLTAKNFVGGKTAVGTFIMDTRAGHCAMYASTMCLSLRYLGIPARYVTGFTVGGGKNYIKTEGGYKYTLAGKDLHAWVEVYYDNVGWLPYDPTPSSYINYNPAEEITLFSETEQTTANESNTAASSALSETTAAAQSEISGDQSNSLTDLSAEEGGDGGSEDYTALRVILIVLGSIGLIIIIILSVRSGLKALSRKEKALFKFFRSGDGAKAARKMLNLSLRLMKLKGVTRKNGETPEEFGARADEALRLNGMLKNAIPLFEREEFDQAPAFTEEEQKQLYIFTKRLAKTVLGNMRNPARLVTRIILFGKGK